MDVGTGELTELADVGVRGLISPSPTSPLVAYDCSLDVTQVGVCVAGRGALFVAAENGVGPAWSPSGDALYFLCWASSPVRRGSESALCVSELDASGALTETRSLVELSENPSHFQLSPSGDVAAVATGQRLPFYEVSSGVAAGVAEPAYAVAFSPSGSHIAFSTEVGVFVARLGTEPAGPGPSLADEGVQVLPLHVETGHWVQQDIEQLCGDNSRYGCDGWSGALRWSPDGSLIGGRSEWRCTGLCVKSVSFLALADGSATWKAGGADGVNWAPK